MCLKQSGFLRKESDDCFIMGSKGFVSEAVTRNLELLSKDKISFQKDYGRVPVVVLESSKPLAVLFEWISAEKKVLYKYANLYLERGFDVLAVSLTVRNLLWPVSGSQVTAADALEFIYKNTSYNILLIHGFSIGGYVWGEVLVKMNEDLSKYQSVIDRIRGQVWDSTPDVSGFYKGFPRAVFPNNFVLRFAVEKSIAYHLWLFHNSATKHYYKSSELFHDTPVKAPALFFISKNDLVASYDTVVKLKESWEKLGRKAQLKSWETSVHVSHLRLHQEEYIQALDDFLSSLDELEKDSEKMHAKL